MMNTFESYLKESIAFSITVRKCLTKETKGRKTYLNSQIKSIVNRSAILMMAGD